MLAGRLGRSLFCFIGGLVGDGYSFALHCCLEFCVSLLGATNDSRQVFAASSVKTLPGNRCG